MRQQESRKHDIVVLGVTNDPIQSFPESQGSEWCEIEQIVGETASSYQVQWCGTDPETGLPWTPDWVNKDAVTEGAKEDWEQKKRLLLSERQKSCKRRPTTPPQLVASSDTLATPINRLSQRFALRDRSSPKKRLEDYFKINYNSGPSLFSQETISEFTQLSPEHRQLLLAMSESPAVKALQERSAARRRQMEEDLEAARRARSGGSSVLRSPSIRQSIVDTQNQTPARPFKVANSNSTSTPILSPAPPASTPASFSTLPSVQLQVKETPRASSKPTPINNIVNKSEPPPSSQISLLTQFERPHLGPDEYVVGLPLSTKRPREGGIHQKDIHLKTIQESSKDISKYISNPDEPEDGLKQRILLLMRKLSFVNIHPDLAFASSALNASDEKMAEYHMIMSSKIQFLKELVDCLKDEYIRIGVVADPVAIDILEIFFRGIKVGHRRLDRLSTLPSIEDKVESAVTVFLIPSTKDSGVVTNNCHVVIGFDSTFNADTTEVKEIRKNPITADLAPVIRLVTFNTIEHLLLCITPGNPAMMESCVEAIGILRHQAGDSDLPYNEAIQQAGSNLSKWIVGKFKGNLGIPPLPEPPLWKAIEATQTQEQNEHADKRKRKPVDISESVAGAVKPDVKKQKVSDEATTDVGDISHITETQVGTQHGTQTNLEPAMAEPVPAAMDEQAMEIDGEETESDEERGLPRARPIYKEAEPSIDDLPREELILQLKAHKTEIAQLHHDAARRQYAYEELRAQHGALLAEQVRADEVKATSMARAERAVAEHSSLKTQVVELKQKEKEILASLSPSQDQQSQLIKKVATLEAANASLQAKLTAAEKEGSYSRDQYQAASTAVLQRATEVQELGERNATLERAADARAVALRTASVTNANAAKDEEINVLRAQIKERDVRIKRWETEKANNFHRGGSRGVVGTRSGSVPRVSQSRASSPPPPPAPAANTARLRDAS